ncbi:hypothetical protein C8Q78DRAFT_646181 [Trametes maxima]|nr:hypothetical protein C8Q78DRAFT_646181 [Trametes maxima]
MMPYRGLDGRAVAYLVAQDGSRSRRRSSILKTSWGGCIRVQFELVFRKIKPVRYDKRPGKWVRRLLSLRTVRRLMLSVMDGTRLLVSDLRGNTNYQLGHRRGPVQCLAPAEQPTFLLAAVRPPPATGRGLHPRRHACTSTCPQAVHTQPAVRSFRTGEPPCTVWIHQRVAQGYSDNSDMPPRRPQDWHGDRCSFVPFGLIRTVASLRCHSRGSEDLHGMTSGYHDAYAIISRLHAHSVPGLLASA